MLTPRFKLCQDDNYVFITVHAPYTKIDQTEVHVDGENFLFVSNPYFLRLRLSGKIVESETSSGKYDVDTGDFNLTFAKVSPGEHFVNLDMITSLLAPRDIPDVNPDLVQVLEESGITLVDSDDDNDDDEEGNEPKRYKYGFANKISTEFENIGKHFRDVFEIRAPEKVCMVERHRRRFLNEKKKFSDEHYLADLYDTELIEPYISAIPFWEEPNFNKDADFTTEEEMVLKELPNKHYLLSKTEYKQVLLGLVDILFGYCYDKRTTQNESTVESSWTINKLSSTLSCFCTYDDMKDLLVACYRRALSQPIFRNFELCFKVKSDVISLLKQGKKFTVKCFIDIHQMFNGSSDARYILNQLYIKDYLVFLQKCKGEDLVDLYNNIANIDITKNSLCLELVELEEAAELVKDESTGILENAMALQMANMTIADGMRKTTLPYDSDDSSTVEPDDHTDTSILPISCQYVNDSDTEDNSDTDESDDSEDDTDDNSDTDDSTDTDDEPS